MPWMTLNTPGGSPASSARSASSEHDSGDHSAGFRMTVPPAASAGAVFQVDSMNGAFQGVITAAGPAGRDDGHSYARGSRKLDRSMEPLPAGSKLRVRPRSALGLKYIELEPGREGGKTLAAGSTIGTRDVRPTVELDEVFNMFSAKARVGQRNSLDGYGGGL